MQKECRQVLLMIILLLGALLCPAQAAEIPRDLPEKLFLSAMDEYRRGHYAVCRAYLQKLAASPLGSEFSAEALLLAVKSLQAEGYYALAQEKLHTWLLLYPQHSQAPQALEILKSLAEKKPEEDKLASRQPPVIRAVQITVLNETDWEEVRKNFRSLRRQGVNTVILRVFHNSGDRKHAPAAQTSAQSGVYFQNDNAPVVADLLGPAAKIAREEGISLWAWMNTRRADWWPQQELREWVYSPKLPQMAYSQGLSPFHPESLSRMRALYRDLARYDIDGILLQDDLNFRQWEGFSPQARKVFRQDKGYELAFNQLVAENPNPLSVEKNSLFWQWSRWRQDKLLQYVEELMTEAREVRPDLFFALNLPYEALTNPGGSLSWFCVDLSSARQYPIDYFAFMTYHRQMEKELKLPRREVVKLLQKTGREMVRALPRVQQALFKVQVLDWETEEVLPAGEVKEVLSALLSQEDVSWVITPYRREVSLGAIMP